MIEFPAVGERSRFCGRHKDNTGRSCKGGLINQIVRRVNDRPLLPLEKFERGNKMSNTQRAIRFSKNLNAIMEHRGINAETLCWGIRYRDWEMFERDYLIAQINRFGGNISRTAEFVGMERSALHRKLKSLGV